MLTAYSVITQLFPAMLLSFGERPRVNAVAAAAGIIAGELTVAAIAVSGASLASLIPSAPAVVKDLNVGIVALVINVAVIFIVSLGMRRVGAATADGVTDADGRYAPTP
jgi:SSS family solute:Na+ symporter